MYISFRNVACYGVCDVLQRGEGYEISIDEGLSYGIAYVGLK